MSPYARGTNCFFFFFPALSPYDKGESNILSFIHLYNFFGFSSIAFLEEEEDVRGACVVVVVVVVRRGGGDDIAYHAASGGVSGDAFFVFAQTTSAQTKG